MDKIDDVNDVNGCGDEERDDEGEELGVTEGEELTEWDGDDFGDGITGNVKNVFKVGKLIILVSSLLGSIKTSEYSIKSPNWSMTVNFNSLISCLDIIGLQSNNNSEIHTS